MKVMILIALSLMCASALAASKVAVVKLMRGEASVLTLGKTTPLKVDDWVEDGAVVKTADKSFVKLIFVDKSSMNVGPNSEMKIESFSGKDSGVIDLVKGKIRSQVTKDYLQINKDKSKLFIKTQNAVMGVRGTDFMISTNGVNTSTVLFEGEIVFNKLENRREMNTTRLEEIVDRGVRMFPGEFSVMDATRALPTVPALLNIQQHEKLEKNKEFDAASSPVKQSVTATVVPAGLSGQQVSNTSGILKTEVSKIASTDTNHGSASSAEAKGYVKGDAFKPANGSVIDPESGKIIQPGPKSTLDVNTNTYTNQVVIDEGGNIAPNTQERAPSSDGPKPPVGGNPPGSPKPENTPTPDDPAPPEDGDQKPNPDLPPMPGPGPQPPQPLPLPPNQLPPMGGTCLGGGICGASDPTRLASPFTDTTIIIKP
ncbi:FecR family protein [Peredibacter starrii]|uniref:FecR family protein n=1 Tax=Peredibacter starrii TaxID=28202 RepID=A0AAX4HLQ6_9BACT|nr:FecR family protein [Peredibacter starrii]WPU64267.1 FecR family protein [Peredibacter starrii]